jgi:hypothetical protein
MMKYLNMSVKASVAALAATTLSLSPQAFADSGPKAQFKIDKQNLKSQHSPKHRDRNDRSRVEILECGSSKYRTRTCYFDVPFRVVDARVINRKSNADCREGKEWGLNRDSIWIRGGCRAVFEVSNKSFSHHHGRPHDDPYGGGRGHDDYHDPYSRISYGEEANALGACSKAANRRAYKQGAYSAQYTRAPEVRLGRRGRIVVSGDVRVFAKHGFRTRHTICRVDRDGQLYSFDYR